MKSHRQQFLVGGAGFIRIHEDDVIKMGRTEDNDVVVRDTFASRHHAVVRSHTGRVIIQDLESRNGTWVNGERVDTAELKDGDRLEFGSQIYIYRDVENSEDQHLELFDFLDNNVDTAAIVTPDSAIPKNDFGGSVSAMPILEICQMAELSRRSGMLIVHPKKGEEGKLYFDNGQIIHASTESLKGEDAAFEILARKDGSFRFHAMPERVEKNISRITSALLLEAMRRQDEG
ncbi:MAG: FHA domain-containing protein [Planctomycetes bacterium]|nr:FHA domain-containing protein [Planctomycetota bacterium]